MFAAALTSFIFTASLLAQDRPGVTSASGSPTTEHRSAATFKAGVDLVALAVTVTDQHQRYVAGLTSEDFQVFEDGVVQNVSFFSASRTPLDLAILLDTSASMGDKLPLAQTAALGLAHSLHSADRAAVIEVKDSVDVRQPFTDDVPTLEAAIKAMHASGGTALYNAIYVALRQCAVLARSHDDVRRQAIVVLTDGEDTVSLLRFDDVLDLAKRSGVAVYTVSLKSNYPTPVSRPGHAYFMESDYSMKSLAEETGARSFFPVDPRELPAIYTAIGEELAAQYAIGYASRNTHVDGAYRRVVVRLVNRPDARPRTRTGYFAGEGAKPAVTANGGSHLPK